MWWLTLLLCHTPDSLAELIVRAQQNAHTRLVVDSTLARAAECIAHEANNGASLSVAVSQYCAEVNGVYDGSVVPLVVGGDDNQDFTQALSDFLAQEARTKHLSHYGAALVHAGRGKVLAVFAAERRGELVVDSATAQSLSFHGSMAAGQHDARCLVTVPGGQTRSIPLVVNGRQFSGHSLLTTSKGRYQLEILADANDGPHVVANLPLFIGVPLPKVPLQAVAGADEKPEERLLLLMNQARQKASAPPLTGDPALAKIALAHATDMRDHHFFAHVSPSTGTVANRLTAAHYSFARVAENLASAPTTDDAFASLMESPGHRKNILEPTLSRAGVGVLEAPMANGAKSRIYVVVFADPPSAQSSAEIEHQLLTAINQIRAQKHQGPLKADSRLSQLATRQSLAMAKREELAYMPSQEQFFAEVSSVARGAINSDLFLSADGQVVNKSQNPGRPVNLLGLGVAPSSGARYGSGLFWITVIYLRTADPGDQPQR